MYDQIRSDTLLAIFYGGVTVMAMMASCYLLLRRANAIVPEITPPICLRRLTGVFFAFIALNNVWYMQIIFLESSDDIKMTDLIGGLLESVTLAPLAIAILFAMLQDRRQPLWPIAVMTAPAALGMVACVASRSDALYPMIYAYALPVTIGLIIYMVREVRRYGRWLRDNYADLEHKEVWQSFIAFAIILLVFVIYEFTNEGPAYVYVMLAVNVVLIGYLLWRVETLSDLSTQSVSGYEVASLLDLETTSPENHTTSKPQNLANHIGMLLQRHCIDTQLYLQHDLNISQLAKAVGTNRSYLSQYFSSQGVTYNTYINDLRINHFTRLCREAVSSGLPFTAQQLASESGYRSYGTFRLAFQQRMGQNVRAWINDMAKNCQNQQK